VIRKKLRQKDKREKLAQDAIAANRFGCGCLSFLIFGLIIAMIVSGYLQLTH